MEETLKPNKKLSPKQRKIIIGAVSGFLALSLIATTYALVIEFVLKDLQHLPYLKYRYSSQVSPEERKIIIWDVEGENYPRDIYVPNQINGYPVCEIADDAFADLEHLSSVRLPDSITRIGSRAFLNSTNLTNIYYGPNIEYIGDYAFENTEFIKNLPTIQGLTMFEGSALALKENFTEPTAIIINADSPVKDQYPNVIDLSAFDHLRFTPALFKDQTFLEYVEMPEEMTVISDSLFEGCTNLEFVDFSNYKAASEYIVGDSAFLNCNALDIRETELFTHNVKSVGPSAFANTATSGLLEISNIMLAPRIFENCTALEKVQLNTGITEIPEYAFAGCTNLNEIYYLTEDETKMFELTNIEILGTAAFQKTALEEFIVPKKVSSIPDALFADCLELRTVSMYDNGPRYMRDQVFRNTPKFEALNILDDAGVVIETGCDINFPRSLTTLGSGSSYAFQSGMFGAYTLNGSAVVDTNTPPLFESVIIPYNTLLLGQSMFYNNTNLKSVVFQTKGDMEGKDPSDPNSGYSNETRISEIGASTFKNCASLTEMLFPNSVTRLGPNLFEGCTNIERIQLPEESSNFGTINSAIFKDCVKLSTLTIPSSVHSINAGAFDNNPSLPYIILPMNAAGTKSSIEMIQAGAFQNNGHLKIFVDIEESAVPTQWRSGWQGDATVYYKGQWNLVDNVPVPIEQP